MTEKRFTIGDRTLQEVYECCIPAILDEGIPCTQSQLLKLLNELHEENMMLKGEVAHYKLMLMSLEKEAKRISQIR